jgi:hypothetical protein
MISSVSRTRPGDRRNRPHHRPQQHPQVRQHGDQAHHSQQPRESQQGHVLAHTGDERQPDHREVEDVPAVAEEVLRAAAVSGNPDRQLDHEDAEEGVLERGQQRVHARAPVVRAHSKRDRVRDDHNRDEVLKPRRVGNARTRPAARAWGGPAAMWRGRGPWGAGDITRIGSGIGRVLCLGTL